MRACVRACVHICVCVRARFCVSLFAGHSSRNSSTCTSTRPSSASINRVSYLASTSTDATNASYASAALVPGGTRRPSSAHASFVHSREQVRSHMGSKGGRMSPDASGMVWDKEERTLIRPSSARPVSSSERACTHSYTHACMRKRERVRGRERAGAGGGDHTG